MNRSQRDHHRVTFCSLPGDSMVADGLGCAQWRRWQDRVLRCDLCCTLWWLCSRVQAQFPNANLYLLLLLRCPCCCHCFLTSVSPSPWHLWNGCCGTESATHIVHSILSIIIYHYLDILYVVIFDIMYTAAFVGGLNFRKNVRGYCTMDYFSYTMKEVVN